MGCVSIPQQMLLVNKARTKLIQCAMVKEQNRDYDLRQMVAHANLLDNLLRTEEEEAKHFECIDAVHEGSVVILPVESAIIDDCIGGFTSSIGKNGEIIKTDLDDMMFDMDDKEYHNLTNCSEMLDQCRRYEDSLLEEEQNKHDQHSNTNGTNMTNNNVNDNDSNDMHNPALRVRQTMLFKPSTYHISSGLEPAEEEQLEYEEEREEEIENLMEQGELPEEMDGYHQSRDRFKNMSPAAQAADQALRDMHYTNAISMAYNNISNSKEEPLRHKFIDTYVRPLT
ncbi:uncharacterized protein RNJ42_01447 [Nakaseomyces bracarensis]|uniref:uncharacterized protein n=1 Tax=Nakaseomyces bracarensis TaxID=273131 RepID=UPI003871536C